MTFQHGASGLLLDANVLIDYLDVDRFVLKLISEHVAPLHTIQEIVEESTHPGHRNRVCLCPDDLTDLGLAFISLELDDYVIAARREKGLSLQDWLCLLGAQRHGLSCVSNDVRLRAQCQAMGIPVVWGIELLAILSERGGISVTEAFLLAYGIHLINPRHIAINIIDRLAERLGLNAMEKARIIVKSRTP